MTITFARAETELLIQQRLGQGDFPDAEAAILDALRAAPAPTRAYRGLSLLEICDELRAATGGIELDITRDRTENPNREIDFL